MKNNLANIEATQIYKLQKDIEDFILRKQKELRFFASVKVLIIDISKSLFNPLTVLFFLVFAISYITSLYLLKHLVFVLNQQKQVNFAFVTPDALLSLFFLFGFCAIIFLLISIFLTGLYYKYQLFIKKNKNSHKASNLLEYLNPSSNKQKSLTINELALYLSEKYDLFHLKFQEEDLKQEIEEHISSRNIAIVPLSFFIFLFNILAFELIIGISTEGFLNNFPTYFGGISFIAFATTIFNFMLHLTLLSSVKFKKEALSALKKAQILITEI